MRKLVGLLAIVGMVAGGFAVSAIVGSPGISAALQAAAEDEDVDQDSNRFRAWIDEALAGLVEDGTLEQAEADAVADALEAARPDRRPRLPGHGLHGHRAGEAIGSAAEVLGMTVDELIEALAGGGTIAGVAEDRGIDPQVVVDAIVADYQERLADAVADGRLTQEQADQHLADITDKVTDMVDGSVGRFGFGGRNHHHHPHRHGFFGPGTEEPPGDSA